MGFALATIEKIAEAMKNFAKAEELGCVPENLVQLYNVLGIICFDIGNAAEIYLQLEDFKQTINCLNAAQNPVDSYNSGFKVVVKKSDTVELTEYDVEGMLEADRAKIAERFGDYGLVELIENTEPDELGNREYFTEIEEESQDDEGAYKLDESQKVNYTPENVDQINRLYIGAYTLKKDFDKVIEYARKLQASENNYNSYIGKYTEANALKELASPDADLKYEEIIKFFRNVMIKDPTDIMAVSLRIQCYIDIGNYDEAEQMCTLLSKEMKAPLLEQIKAARTGGD